MVGVVPLVRTLKVVGVVPLVRTLKVVGVVPLVRTTTVLEVFPLRITMTGVEVVPLVKEVAVVLVKVVSTALKSEFSHGKTCIIMV